MESLTEVEIFDMSKYGLEKERLDHISHIAAYNQARDNIYDNLDMYEDKIRLQEHLLTNITIANGLPKELKVVAAEKRRTMKDELKYIQHDVENNLSTVKGYESSITNYVNALMDADAQLKRLDSSPRVLTLEELKSDLSDQDNIPQDSIKLDLDGNGMPILYWKYVGVVCKPHNNPLVNILNPEFIVPNNTVKFDLVNHNLRFNPEDESEESLPQCHDNNRVVHPHVLSGHYPCLGDFASNIVEAIDDGDYSTLATITQLFLEQADERDSAGKYWVRHVLTQTYGNPDRADRSQNINVEIDDRIFPVYGEYSYDRNEKRIYKVPFIYKDHIEEFEGNHEALAKMIKKVLIDTNQPERLNGESFTRPTNEPATLGMLAQEMVHEAVRGTVTATRPPVTQFVGVGGEAAQTRNPWRMTR